jgi:hypothetical protein
MEPGAVVNTEDAEEEEVPHADKVMAILKTSNGRGMTEEQILEAMNVDRLWLTAWSAPALQELLEQMKNAGMIANRVVTELVDGVVQEKRYRLCGGNSF